MVDIRLVSSWNLNDFNDFGELPSAQVKETKQIKEKNKMEKTVGKEPNDQNRNLNSLTINSPPMSNLAEIQHLQRASNRMKV